MLAVVGIGLLSACNPTTAESEHAKTWDLRISHAKNIETDDPDYNSTVLMHPGGPPAPGLPFAAQIQHGTPDLKPTTNYVSFDQRGIGQSGIGQSGIVDCEYRYDPPAGGKRDFEGDQDAHPLVDRVPSGWPKCQPRMMRLPRGGRQERGTAQSVDVLAGAGPRAQTIANFSGSAGLSRCSTGVARHPAALSSVRRLGV